MNLPAWHDAKAWVALIKEMKAASGAEGVLVEFDMPHGIHTYDTKNEEAGE